MQGIIDIDEFLFLTEFEILRSVGERIFGGSFFGGAGFFGFWEVFCNYLFQLEENYPERLYLMCIIYQGKKNIRIHFRNLVPEMKKFLV